MNSDQRHERYARRGFTLIELVTVIVVLAVIAAAAAPSLDSLQETRGAHAAKTLQRDLTWSRQRSLATGTVTWVVFDADAETWSILAEDPDAPGRGGASIVTDAATGRNWVQTLGTAVFNGITIASVDIDDDVEIGFDWRGRPLNAAETDLAETAVITLSGGYEVEVVPETGHVRRVMP